MQLRSNVRATAVAAPEILSRVTNGERERCGTKRSATAFRCRTGSPRARLPLTERQAPNGYPTANRPLARLRFSPFQHIGSERSVVSPPRVNSSYATVDRRERFDHATLSAHRRGILFTSDDLESPVIESRMQGTSIVENSSRVKYEAAGKKRGSSNGGGTWRSPSARGLTVKDIVLVLI